MLGHLGHLGHLAYAKILDFALEDYALAVEVTNIA